MNKHIEKRVDLWWTWNYEKEQQRLDKLSQQGMHLIKPGLFRGSYTRDSAVRYVYRLDYQSDLRKESPLKDYLNLYQDAGWTYMGRCVGWYYFRRTWVPEKTLEIYTDRESLKQQYRRIQRMFGLVLIVELILLFVNINNLLILPNGRHLWPSIAPLLALSVASVFLLGRGYSVMNRKIKGIDKR